MKSLITHPIGTIPKNIASHKGSQAAIYAAELEYVTEDDICINFGAKQNLNDYDVLYVYHGNDFTGGLNLFGGMKNYGGIHQVIDFSNFKGKVISLAIEMPSYSLMFKDRMSKGEYHSDWDKVDWDNLKHIEETADHYVNIGSTNNHYVFGDSHAISLYRPGVNMISVPYKTLHGMIKEEWTSGFFPKRSDILDLYFGNIDIRHHLGRMEDPIKSTKELCDRYMNKIESTFRFEKINIFEPLAIENELRKVPKSGWYKDKPFHGSWELRNKIRLQFNKSMLQLTQDIDNIDYIQWTDYLINSSGELDFKYMEKPRSVHLSREFYPFWQGQFWNDRNIKDIDYTKLKKITLESFYE